MGNLNKKKLKNQIEVFQGTEILPEFENLSFTIVLVRPETAGNIGSIARIMKNFNFNKLVIFNPLEKIEMIYGYETQGFAMHGKDILLGADIILIDNQEDHLSKFKKFVNNFDLVIATTAKGMHFRNVRRIAIFPDNLELPVSKKHLEVAVLFGKESRGLTNEEIELADISLRIPTGEDYPAMNLSHACAIILYELYKKMHGLKIGRGINPVIVADREDKQILITLYQNVLEKLKIRSHKKQNVVLSFKNVINRAMMTRKELSMIIGVFSKLDNLLEKNDIY